MGRLNDDCTATKKTADALIKTGSGYLDTITIAQTDAAPTAGTIEISDSTDGGSGVFFTWNVLTTTFLPFTIHLHTKFTTGLYINFTTTADVGVTLSYV
jgi:hypothetical protein